MEPITILIEQLVEIGRSAVELMPQLIAALIIVGLTFLVAAGVKRIVARLVRRDSLRKSLQELFVLLAAIVTWVTGLVIAAVVLFPNLTPSSILTGLGIGSVAIGLAFKDIFENFFAGIIILFRSSMRIGDFIESGDYTGKVERITVRETYVRQVDGELIILPNATLFKNPLRVVTDLDERRMSIVAGVAYGEDVDEARGVIEEAVKSCPSVNTDTRPVQVFALEFGSSSINYEVAWWTGSTPLDERSSRDEVVAAIKRGLDDAGIEIPFPYRTLTFKEPLPIARDRSGTSYDEESHAKETADG